MSSFSFMVRKKPNLSHPGMIPRVADFTLEGVQRRGRLHHFFFNLAQFGLGFFVSLYITQDLVFSILSWLIEGVRHNSQKIKQV